MVLEGYDWYFFLVLGLVGFFVDGVVLVFWLVVWVLVCEEFVMFCLVFVGMGGGGFEVCLIFLVLGIVEM